MGVTAVRRHGGPFLLLSSHCFIRLLPPATSRAASDGGDDTTSLPSSHPLWLLQLSHYLQLSIRPSRLSFAIMTSTTAANLYSPPLELRDRIITLACTTDTLPSFIEAPSV